LQSGVPEVIKVRGFDGVDKEYYTPVKIDLKKVRRQVEDPSAEGNWL